MKLDIFHLKIKEREISYKFSGIPFKSDLVDEIPEEEAYVVKILHKVLNIQLPLKEAAIIEREDFAALGKKLSSILFPDTSIKGILSQKFERAQDQKDYRCRLILEFDRSTAEIASLPWEYLYFEPKDEYGKPIGPGEFLAADSKCSFDLIRKIPFGESPDATDGPAAHEIETPVKILLVTANPDGELHEATIDRTIEYFSTLQQQLSDRVVVKHIAQPDFSTFQQLLKDMCEGANGQTKFVPDIIHFAGHGKLDKGQAKIAFVEQGSLKEEWIGDNDFADFFDEIHKPKMIFLQISEGAKIGDYENNKGLVLQLLSKKIPAVVAIQNPVANWIAREFVKVVYHQFLEGKDIAKAVTIGRFHLARKLKITDHEGNKRENYSHKSFGSPAVFISTSQPVTLYQEKSSPAELPAEEMSESSAVASSERAASSRSPVSVNTDVVADQSSEQGPTIAPVEKVEEAGAIRATSINVTTPESKELTALKTKAKLKLGNNELLSAIQILLESVSVQSNNFDRLSNFKAELKSIQLDYDNGLIPASDRRQTENRVRNALFQLVRGLKNHDLL